MKTRYTHEKLFSLYQFLTQAICFVVLLGLTVVCLSGPLLDYLDRWMDDLRHQIIAWGAVAFVNLVLWGWFKYRR